MAPIHMKGLPEPEYEYIAKGFLNEDRCNLGVSREILESRGWKRGAQGRNEEESSKLEIERGLYKNENWNNNAIEDEDGNTADAIGEGNKMRMM